MSSLGKILDLIKALGQLVVFTMAYLGGRRSVAKEIEAETNKKGLEEATRVYDNREKVRFKYERVKFIIPNNWSSVEQLRKTNKN